MTFRCGSAHSKCKVWVPSAGSVSATGIHPSSANASAVSGWALRDTTVLAIVEV
jgi:hypothetical protein